MRSALEVAEVFRRHGAAYRQAHAGHLSQCQRRVMAAIEACRTAALGGHVEQCDDCGQVRIAYNSCRNRHCPKCQGLARAEWLADRQAELLPVPYFHVVFTVPAPIAEIAFQNKTVVYGILFKAAAETLRLIAADPKHLGAALGLVAVLHTWGQNLHPSGALLRPADRSTAPPRRPSQPRLVARRDHRVHRPAQRRSQAVPLDQIGRRHPRQHRALLPPRSAPSR